jgi:hypothetical protein
MPFERVSPGDLITANLVNRMMTAIEDLQVKVAGFESSTSTASGPVILDVLPSRTIQLGQSIAIVGRNFAQPPDHNDVSIGGVPVVRFAPGSSASQLNVTVPTSIANVPGPAALIVAVDDRSDSITVQVEPEQVIPKGQLIITDTTPSLGTIAAGETITLIFNVDSQTTVPETYTLRVAYTALTGATAATWQAATKLFDATGQALPAALTLFAARPAVVIARIVIPEDAQTATLALSADSHHNAPELSRSSAPITLVVGARPVENSPATKMTLSIGSASKARKTTIDGLEGIEFPYNHPDFLSVKVNMSFTEEGPFDFSVTVEPDAGSWEVEPANPSSGAGTKGTQSSVTTRVKLKTADAGATHPERRMLVFHARHATGEFESFTAYPIQGFVLA